MYVVVLHKHSFTQYQYDAKSIAFAGNTYTVTDVNNNTHTFSKDDYLVAIMSQKGEMLWMDS